MSGEALQPPVAKYGRSSEFAVVLDFIQSMLSDDTLRQAFNIPHLVVVGRQNMAKTTLINRLIGKSLLPMRRHETVNNLQACTTYPIILNLRYGDKSVVEVKCSANDFTEARGENPDDTVVENFLNGVAEKLPKMEGTLISNTPVNVTLQGPEFTTLTLVDLPGVHFANNDPKMNRVTQNLVLEYIEKNPNSIIVIVSEVGDPTGDGAIDLVMKKAAHFRSRTICALTKPDRLRKTDDMGKRVALNKSSFTLEEDRFIILRGKDSTDEVEKDWDAKTTREKEKEWFAEHPQYKDIQHVCGIDRLMDTMISLLVDRMRTQIPILLTEMKKRKKEVDKELEKLQESEVPESMEKKGELMMKLKQNLINELEKLLKNNTSQKKGGEIIRDLFSSFHEDAFRKNPLAGRSDREIWEQLKKLEGAVAPLGESSENNQLLQKLLYEEYTAYEANGQTDTVPSPVDQLLSISEKLVNDVEKTLRDIVQGVIDNNLLNFSTLKKVVEAKVVRKIFAKQHDQAMEFIRQFMEMQKKSTDEVFAPVPMPSEICNCHPCTTSKTMKRMKCLAESLYSKQMINGIENPLSAKYFTYKEQEEMKNIKRNVVRCFNVLKMNVCDTVPRCILHFFVTQLVDDLERALDEENLVEFLEERRDIRDRRIWCRNQSHALKEMLPQAEKLEDVLLRMNSQK